MPAALAMLATVGRVLVQHWPALVALQLAGVLGRYAVIELAGWVAAGSPTAGLVILPLAVLVRVAAFVGMFLVLRDGLRELSAIAPPPADPASRRRAFLGGMLGGILPFFAVYSATGSLREDFAAYSARALEVQTSRRLQALAEGEEYVGPGIVFDVPLDAVTIGLIVVALAGRWAWGRWQRRLPQPLAIAAVYLEGVWVFLTVTLVGDLLDDLRAWVDSRQAVAWVADARAWLDTSLAPVAWAWDGLDWVLGQAGAALGQPLAWLTIAGVIYGQAVAAEAPTAPRRLAAARARFSALPEWLQAQLRQVGVAASSRFAPIWRAFVLMLRGGPVLLGVTALLFALAEWLRSGLEWAITRMVGPQGFDAFWMLWDAVLLLPAAVAFEVLRIAIAAGGYDALLGRLRRPAAGGSVPTGSVPTGSGPVEQHPGEVGPAVEQLDVDHERAGVVGHDERLPQRDGRGRLEA